LYVGITLLALTLSLALSLSLTNGSIMNYLEWLIRDQQAYDCIEYKEST